MARLLSAAASRKCVAALGPEVHGGVSQRSIADYGGPGLSIRELNGGSRMQLSTTSAAVDGRRTALHAYRYVQQWCFEDGVVVALSPPR